MGWYFTITEEMRDLGLKGNELVVYALIHNRSHSGSGCWWGSQETLSSICGVSSRAIRKILKSLEDKGLVKKGSARVNGGIRPAYVVAYRDAEKSSDTGKKFRCDAEKSSANNNSLYINNTLSIRAREKFEIPSVDEVREYCESRGNGINAQAFWSFYNSKGWTVGSAKMTSWKDAVITWENRNDPNVARPAGQPRQQETTMQHNLRVADRLFGTNYAKGVVNNQTDKDYDEQ